MDTVTRKEYSESMVHVAKSLVLLRQCVECLDESVQKDREAKAQDIDLLKDSMLKVLDLISDLQRRVLDLERAYAVYEFTRIA